MDAPPDARVLLDIPTASIEPNPLQPRRRFSPHRIEALARSIEGQGVLQPVVVRSTPGEEGRYQLVAGERRLRAMRLLGLASVPALLWEVPDEHLLEAALVENLQREPLNPVEEAEAYRALLQQYGYSQEALAARLGKDRSTIANMIRLLSLPPLLREDLEEGRLTPGHARALLSLPEPDRQIALRGVVISKALSVRETERLVARSRKEGRGAAGEPPETGPGRGAAGHPAEAGARERLQFAAVQEMLERRFSTRVSIRSHPDGGKAALGDQGGRIEMEFYSMEDFNRIFDLLSGRQNSDED